MPLQGCNDGVAEVAIVSCSGRSPGSACCTRRRSIQLPADDKATTFGCKGRAGRGLTCPQRRAGDRRHTDSAPSPHGSLTTPPPIPRRAASHDVARAWSSSSSWPADEWAATTAEWGVASLRPRGPTPSAAADAATACAAAAASAAIAAVPAALSAMPAGQRWTAPRGRPARRGAAAAGTGASHHPRSPLLLLQLLCGVWLAACVLSLCMAAL